VCVCGCVGVRVGEVGAEAGDPLKFGVSLELFQRLTIFKPRIILLVSWKKNSRQAGDLTERQCDARIATAVSHLIGVFFSCAPFLQISRTLAEFHWARRRRHHDHAASCSSAPQELSLRALDLPA